MSNSHVSPFSRSDIGIGSSVGIPATGVGVIEFELSSVVVVNSKSVVCFYG